MRASGIASLRDTGTTKLTFSVCALALFACASPATAVAATCAADRLRPRQHQSDGGADQSEPRQRRCRRDRL